MRSLALLVGAAVVILLLSGVLAAINEFRTTDIEEPYNVSTGSEETSVDIILVHELFGDNTISAAVTSNLTGDAPVASAYDSTTRELTVTGLQENNSRRLTIDYETDALTDYPAAGLVARMWPLMLGIGVIGLVVAAVISAVRRGE